MIEFFNTISDIFNKIVDGIVSIFSTIANISNWIFSSIDILPTDFVVIFSVLITIGITIFIVRFIK